MQARPAPLKHCRQVATLFLEGRQLRILVGNENGQQLRRLGRAAVLADQMRAARRLEERLPGMIVLDWTSRRILGANRSGDDEAEHITGVTMRAPETNVKRLTLLHEAIPKARRIAALTVSADRYEIILREMRSAAASAGVDLLTFSAETAGAYPATFTAMRSAGAQALIIVSAPEFNRDAEILAALGCVNAVIIFDEADPQRIIDRLQPDVLVKGADWAPDRIIGRETVEARGGRVVRIPLAEGYSTSAIIKKIQRL